MFRMCELFDMDEPLSIKSFRSELGLTLDQFGEKVGLSSKGQVSEIERSGRASLRVALAIEALSDGRIDAGALCDEVRLAREAVHAPADTATPAPASPGQCVPESPSLSPSIGEAA